MRASTLSTEARPAVTFDPGRRLEWVDLAVLGFLLTAGVSFWAAYDRTLGGAKFVAIAGAIAVYWGLARSSLSGLWKAATLFGVLGAAFSGLILLSLFLGNPLATRGAGASVGLDPPGFLALDADSEVGLVAVLLPFQVAVASYAWRQGEPRNRIGWTAGCLLSAGALFVGNSRGAVVASALAGGGVLWLAWTGTTRPTRRLLLLAAPLVGLLAVAGYFALSGSLAGARETLLSRVQLAQEGLWLAQDFGLTGGGLGSFPGLYSRYILIEPFPFYSRSYNLFLDLVIEQGLLALVSYLAICAGSLWSLSATRRYPSPKSRRVWLMQAAAAASLLTVLILGMVHDPFSEPIGALFLLVGPGFAASLRRSSDVAVRVSTSAGGDTSGGGVGRRLSPVHVGGLAIALAAIGWWSWPRLPATLWANIGSVRLAQIELKGWPEGKRRDPNAAFELARARRYLESSLAWDPANRAANYRLGLLALEQEDFDEAAEYLERAWAQADGHRGIRKALGYSYAWLGRLDQAAEVLRPIPEASRELRAFARRWRDRGRPDLAEWAAALSARLEASG